MTSQFTPITHPDERDPGKDFGNVEFYDEGGCDLVTKDGARLRMTEAETEWVDYLFRYTIKDSAMISQVIRNTLGRLQVREIRDDGSVVIHDCPEE